jgi:hypothetical protein
MHLRHIILIFALAGIVLGQGPKIGTINFYGLHKVPEARIRKALGVAEGGSLPSSKGEVEERIADVPGVVQAHLEATCCDESGQAILYVGIEEKGAPHFDLRTPPEVEIELPEAITINYREFLLAVAEAARKGLPAEDLTQGHSLMAAPEPRSFQMRFIELAGKYTSELRNVLRNSGDAEQRAIAAYVIGYAPKKKTVVDDLQYALKDPDDTVRGNAIRALAAISVYGALNKDSDVKISPTWFIEMLNSISWTDRNNAAVALVNLTESRDPSTLQQLKERALPSLVDMARFKHLAHALPAYILLGRADGLPEKEIQDAWASGDREKIIEAALKKK